MTESRRSVHLGTSGADDAPVKLTEALQSLRDPGGRYQLLDEIGRGGIGIVYKGRDRDLGRDVAMKMLKDEHATRPEILARFVEEAQIGGQLQHPGIVPVYELGLQAGERPYLAMKLVQGETLAEQLGRRSDVARDRRRFIGIFEQVCQTIAYAHARHVVHRDLKPANVMIGAFGEVQVVDWGLAKVLSRVDAAPTPAPQQSRIETVRSHADSTLDSHSIAGSTMGTPAYMPPEQARGDVTRVDERSDVFALGAILCEILTGDPPYRSQDGDLLRQAANAELEGARERLRKCGADEALVAMTRECLAPSPSARPKSAAEVAERVSAYLTSVEERARQAEVRAVEARLENRVTLVSAAAGLIVLALGAGGWMWLDAQARARRDTATQRVASAMSAASGAHGRAQSAGFDTSLWSTAVASAEQLVSLATSDDVDAKTRGDAEALLATVSAEAAAARAESDRLARDARMLASLEAARIPADEDVRKNAIPELRRLDAAYAAAFAAYQGGPSLLDRPSESSLASLRRGDIEIELAASLDHWGLVRDELRDQPEPPDPAGTARLREIAVQLDPGDAWRAELRSLLPNAARESARLRELAERADFAVVTAVGCRVLSQALWSAGEKEMAVLVLQRGQELHPRDFDLSFRLALQLDLLDEPRPLEALAAYRVAQAIRPEQREVLHRQVLILSRLGRHADEERLSRGMVARDPVDSHALFHLGFALKSQGRSDEAIACFRRAIDLDPSDSLTHSNLGDALQDRGRPEEAIASYRRAIELKPMNSHAHHNLGGVLEARGRFDEAIASYRTAIELTPTDANAHNSLGAALTRSGRKDEAVASFRRAVELDPTNAAFHDNLAKAHDARGEPDEAIASYRRAIELRPGHAQTHSDFSVLLRGQGRLEEAIASCRRALEIDPEFLPAHINLAGVFLQQGKLDDAIASCRRAIEIDETCAPAHFNLGEALSIQGKLEEALSSFRRAASLWEPRRDDFSIAWFAEATRKIEEVQRGVGSGSDFLALTRGDRAPKDAGELANAALLVHRRGDYVLSARLFARVLEEFPDFLEVYPHRYNAACGAAMVGCGEGEGAAALSDEERAAWRERARSWLGSEVVRWRTDLAGIPDRRRAAKEQVTGVLTDPDFARVREDEALGRLPAAEAAAWRALWEEIAALLATVEERR